MDIFRVGVLSIQGNVEEHRVHTVRAINKMNISCRAEKIKSLKDFENLHGLIIPGGESTTISKLMRSSGIFEKIKTLGISGMPVMGTCAGTIMLSKNIIDKGNHDVLSLGLMDMNVARNSYGRQVDSFEDYIDISGEKFPGVFIRAPQIISVQGNCKAYGHHADKIVMAVEGNHIATTFHPELTSNTFIHEMFLKRAETYYKSTLE